MLESENWVIPTFNYELRVDKPALLYWLQIQAYRQFGVSEFSARLPSALAATLTLFVVYELGRLLFGSTTALISAIGPGKQRCVWRRRSVLPTRMRSQLILHSDALLLLAELQRGRPRLVYWSSGCMGFAVLTKGPVGIVLPATVITLFLWSQGHFARLVGPTLSSGLPHLTLVAAPWYTWVAADTKASFLTGFLLKHNVGRYLSPMENHHGTDLLLPDRLGGWSSSVVDIPGL